MLIIDIDHFKSINDQHGHPEGDEALKRVAERLRSQVREPAFIGRLGGEEFVVVLPGVDQQEAQRVADQFREEVMTIDTRRWTGRSTHHCEHWADHRPRERRYFEQHAATSRCGALRGQASGPQLRQNAAAQLGIRRRRAALRRLQTPHRRNSPEARDSGDFE